MKTIRTIISRHSNGRQPEVVQYILAASDAPNGGERPSSADLHGVQGMVLNDKGATRQHLGRLHEWLHDGGAAWIGVGGTWVWIVTDGSGMAHWAEVPATTFRNGTIAAALRGAVDILMGRA